MNSYRISCKKEEQFMSFLKRLNYKEKHPNKYNKIINDKNINSKINEVNNIYKPVKIKVDSSTNCNEEKRNENNIYEIKMVSSEEDNELCEKIKSQPFLNKKKI